MFGNLFLNPRRENDNFLFDGTYVQICHLHNVKRSALEMDNRLRLMYPPWKWNRVINNCHADRLFASHNLFTFLFLFCTFFFMWIVPPEIVLNSGKIGSMSIVHHISWFCVKVRRFLLMPSKGFFVGKYDHKNDARDNKQSNGCFSYMLKQRQPNFVFQKPFLVRLRFYISCSLHHQP